MRINKGLTLSLTASAYLVSIILALIVIFMLSKSLPFFQQVSLSALWRDDWLPSLGAYNILPMLIGSLLVTLGAVLVAAPLGLMLAIWGRYYAPKKLARIYQGLVELLAGIPSVVYGFWGLIVLVPWLTQLVPPGASLLAAIIILALMILPLVVLSSDAAFSQVPKSWLNAADALAITRWSKVWRLILPNAMAGISAGVILQTGRAIGETMAVLMVSGNIVQIPSNIFQPVRTLTANIALEMSYAVDLHLDALFVTGLVLLIVTGLLIVLGHKIKGSSDENA